MNQNIITSEYLELVEQLKVRGSESRYQAARTVNNELIKPYHYIGSEIIKRQEKYGWGAKVIDNLSRDLHAAFPEMKGFTSRNLKYMRRFAEEYKDIEFVQQVAAQLPWFHIVILLDKVKKIINIESFT